MRIILLIVFSALLIGGCSNRVTSRLAERVTLYNDENMIPDHCEKLGEFTTSVCANTTPCPAEVMKRDLREKAIIDYGADAVWLVNTTLSGTNVVGYGIAYKCNK
jgi:hypothetical protein